VKEKILVDLPVPKNIKPVQELDGFLKEILNESGKSITVYNDKVFKNLGERSETFLGRCLIFGRG